MKHRFDLEERLLKYAAEVIRFVEALPDTRTANHVGNQLMRAGTSVLGNHGEAQAAESTDDFVHKMKICLKELRECHRWLRLILHVPLVPAMEKAGSLLRETDELIRIFYKSIQTARSHCGD